MMAIIRLCLAACMWIVFSRGACAEEVIYTFAGPDDGGLALVSLDPATGAFGEQRVLGRHPSLRSIRKLAIWHGPNGARVVGATVEGAPPGNIVIVPLPQPGEAQDTPTSIRVDAPAEADEIRATREGFLVGCEDGWLVHVALDPGSARPGEAMPPPAVHAWSARSQLRPSGAAAEDIRVRADGASAWITFQKDSKKGDHKGHRLVRLALPALEVLHDQPLDRTRTEHHPPKSPRDHGPSPEIVLEDPITGTLLVTLDNYGAVMLSDLKAALDGKWPDSALLSTAIDGSFGSSYPDRAVIVPRRVEPGEAPGSVALVANAGPAGGAVVIDLATRTRTGAMACPSGLESLTLIPGSQLVVAAAAGKRKVRSDGGAVKRLEPSPELVIFDLTRPTSPSATTVRAEGASEVRWVSGFRRGPEVIAVERDAASGRDRLSLLRITRAEDGAVAAQRLGVLDSVAPVQRVIDASPLRDGAAQTPRTVPVGPRE